MERILFAVSTSVSPLLTLDEDAEKFIMSAESLFCANSKESFVLVLFSKNKFYCIITLS